VSTRRGMMAHEETKIPEPLAQGLILCVAPCTGGGNHDPALSSEWLEPFAVDFSYSASTLPLSFYLQYIKKSGIV